MAILNYRNLKSRFDLLSVRPSDRPSVQAVETST